MSTVYTNFGRGVFVNRIDGTEDTFTPGNETVGSGIGADTLDVNSVNLVSEVVDSRGKAGKSQPSPDTNQWRGGHRITTPLTVTEAGLYLFGGGSSSLCLGVGGLSIPMLPQDVIDYTFSIQQT